MKKVFALLYLITVWAYVLPASPVQLYRGEMKLPAGWWELSWGNTQVVIEPEVRAKDQKASLAILVSPQTEPWAGGGLQKAPEGNPLPLNPELMQKGLLVFDVNGGIQPDGTRVGGQRIKVSVKLVDEHGNVLPAPPESEGGEFCQVEARYITGGSIDDDSESWQSVKIPLLRFAPPSGSPEPAGIISFAIQFDDPQPSSGVYITNIGLNPGGSKP